MLLLASCNGVATSAPGDETLAQPASPPTSANLQTETEMTQPTPPPGMESLIEKAQADLAQLLSISGSQITLIEAQAVVWHDASLGCPKPGIDYIRVETPVYSIILEAGGKKYTYHTNEDNRVIRCNK